MHIVSCIRIFRNFIQFFHTVLQDLACHLWVSIPLSSSSDSSRSAKSLSNLSLNDDSDFEAMLPSGLKSKWAKWGADVKARIKTQWARYSCLCHGIVINICAILKERF